MAKQSAIIDINGTKVEVDLTHARKVTTFRVGDPVKVLKKRYGDEFTVHTGFVAAIDAFEALPTISICHIAGASYEQPKLEMLYFNAKSKDVEIMGMSEADLHCNRDSALASFNEYIHKKRIELEDLVTKRDFFLRSLGAAFSVTAADMPAEA